MIFKYKGTILDLPIIIDYTALKSKISTLLKISPQLLVFKTSNDSIPVTNKDEYDDLFTSHKIDSIIECVIFENSDEYMPMIKLDRIQSIMSSYSHPSSSFSDAENSTDEKDSKISRGVSTISPFTNFSAQTDIIEIHDKHTSIEITHEHKATQYDLPSMIDVGLVKKILQEEINSFISKYKFQQAPSTCENDCTNCNKNLTNSNKYACGICERFTVCEECEESLNHPHPLYKYKIPRKTEQETDEKLNTKQQKSK